MKKTPQSQIPQLMTGKKQYTASKQKKSHNPQAEALDSTPWDNSNVMGASMIRTGTTRRGTQSSKTSSKHWSSTKSGSGPNSLMSYAKVYANVIPSDEDLIAQITAKMPDFKMTVNNLKNPTTEFITQYYIRVLEEFEIDSESVMQPTEKQLQGLTYKDVYSDGLLYLMNLFITLKKMYNKICVQDFTFSDLFEPKASRIRILIFMMDNFHNFADNKYGEMEPIFAEMREKSSAYQTLHKQRKELQEKLFECENDSENTEFFEQLEKEKEALSTELDDLQTKRDHGKEEVFKLTTEEKEDGVKLLQIRSAIGELKVNVKQLRDSLGDSPSTLQRKTEHIREKLAKVEAEYKILRQRKEDIKTLLEKIEAATEDEKDRLKLLTMAQDIHTKQTKVGREVKESHEKLDSKKHEELSNEISELEIELASVKENIAKTKEHFEQQISAMKSSEARCKESIKNLEKKIEKEEGAIKLKIKANATEVDGLTEQYNRQVANFYKTYADFKKMEADFHKKLDSKLDEVSIIVKEKLGIL